MLEECYSTNKQKGVRIEYDGKQLTMGTEVSSIHDDAGKETSHERDHSARPDMFAKAAPAQSPMICCCRLMPMKVPHSWLGTSYRSSTSCPSGFSPKHNGGEFFVV